MGEEKLTPKQKAFCDEYLICGNATKAAKKAGYSEKTAMAIGNENLRKPLILGYIKKRQKEIDDAKIADIQEVLEYFTSVMRGEVKDQFDLDVSVADRMAAGRELIKRFEKTEGQKEYTGGITIINNIPRPEDMNGDS